jgi:FAD/FMN-containing dehydrogenase
MYRDLEQKMDKVGMYIPSYPASKDMCSIGGMVANNAAGANTYRYGHTAQYVRALNIVLADGVEYHIRPLEWSEFEQELERDDALGAVYRYIWELCLHHEELLLKARPKTRKNSAGYALWDVVSTTVEEFMQGRGVFDLTQIISGSQGTLGIITRVWIQAVPKATETSLVAIPLRNYSLAGTIIAHTAQYNPINIELFDGPTYKTARAHPDFFKDRMSASEYKTFSKALRNHYNITLKRRVPAYFLLVTLPKHESPYTDKLVHELKRNYKVRARQVANKNEADMLWQIRRASYSLSKLSDPRKRPAAFLEDMTVPQEHLGDFLQGIRELFDKHDITALVHGHGGNGHLHFYPLLDFTQANTADNIKVMAQEFFALATSLGGSICGEHNDGIIRTPYLDTMFSQEILKIFARLERVCDPHDIFNSGKKVRPRFKLGDVIRHTN